MNGDNQKQLHKAFGLKLIITFPNYFAKKIVKNVFCNFLMYKITFVNHLFCPKNGHSQFTGI